MNKELYKKFSADNELPFSLKYSWWDEVVKKDWEVALVENQGQVLAFWPYFIRRKLGFTLLGQANITPYCGPYIIYPENQKNHSKFSYEKKLLEKLLEQLPKYAHFEQNCHFDFHNCLPLIWKGFDQSNRYTYILNNIVELDLIYSNFAGNIKREIKKAEKITQVIESNDVQLLHKLVSSTFLAQNKEIPIPNDIFDRFGKYIQKYQCGKIFLAKDQQGNFVAGIGIIWDHSTAYYILGGADEKYKNSGAMSLLMWKAIQHSAKSVGNFNFEGSMIPSIEKFLRAFGGKLSSYNKIKHSSSNILSIIKYFQ